MFTAVTNNETETENVGAELAKTLRPGDVVALFGNLGAGKTAFVRGAARELGVTCRVTSPTYTIVNEYPGRVPVCHFDMYRLSDSGELFDIGWEDYLGRKCVLIIEWAEIVEDALPEGYIRVRLEHDPSDENVRHITIIGSKLNGACD